MSAIRKFLKPVFNFFNHQEINSILTTIFLFISLYTSVVTLYGESFWLPLAYHEKPTEEDVTVKTVFFVFLLLLAGIFATRTSKALRLPQLFGCLVIGIIIRNISVLNNFFEIPPFVETMIRKIALTMIVIRWGLATDVLFLYKNAIMPTTIGLLSVIGEIFAVTISSYFILKISFIMSIFCALILVIVSPAVTVPAMIAFKEKKLGALNKIPENVLAVCCVDNLFCVIIFMVLSSIIFTDAPIATTILLNVGTILAGIIGGIIIGFLFWIFPRPDAPHTQFTRIALLGLVSISMMIGTYLIKYSCSGFIATLITSAMCAMKWRTDNTNGLISVESTYKYIWESFALPLLFICLGLKFDFSTLTWDIVLLCIAVIAIGLLVRAVLVFLITIPSRFNFKEKLVIALSLLPRATFQADLAPTLLVMATPFPEKAKDAELIMKAAILSVLVTAPIFDILLNLVGFKCLSRSTQVAPIPEENLEKANMTDDPIYLDDHLKQSTDENFIERC